MPKFNIFWMYAIMIAFLLAMYFLNDGSTVAQEVNWTQFEKIVNGGGVKSITVYTNKNYAEAVLIDSVAKEVNKGIPRRSTPFGDTETVPNKIATQIPSPDKFDSKVEQWKDMINLILIYLDEI